MSRIEPRPDSGQSVAGANLPSAREWLMVGLSVLACLTGIQLGIFLDLPVPVPDNFAYGMARGIPSSQSLLPAAYCALLSFHCCLWSRAGAYSSLPRLLGSAAAQWKTRGDLRVVSFVAGGFVFLLALAAWPYSLWFILFGLVIAALPFLLRRGGVWLWVLPAMWLSIGYLTADIFSSGVSRELACSGTPLRTFSGESIRCDSVVLMASHGLVAVRQGARSRLVARETIDPASIDPALRHGSIFFFPPVPAGGD